MAIDQVLVGRGRRVRVAQVRTYVSAQWQEQVRERLIVGWEKIAQRALTAEVGSLPLEALACLVRK